MKVKIKEALQQRYKDTGVGEKAFDGVADFLAKTIKEESDIADAVANAEPFIKAHQGELDRLRGKNSELEKENKALKEEKKPEPNPTPSPTPQNSDELEMLKNQVKELIDKQQQQEAARSAEAMRGAVKSALKEAGVPERYIDTALSGYPFTKETNVEDLVNTTKAGYEALVAELTNDKFKGGNPPDKSGGNPENDPFAKLVSAAKEQLEPTNK